MRVAGLNDVITYWAPEQNDRFGVRSFAAPILINGRWENRTEEVATQGGDLINSKAIIMVDRDLLTQGYLALGDFTGQNEPSAVLSASEIRAYRDGADLRSVSRVREAVL